MIICVVLCKINKGGAPLFLFNGISEGLLEEY
jgi:hypothetical protein